METQPNPIEALQLAVTHVGGQSALGRLCKVTQGAVWRWLQNGKGLPPQHVLCVEAATGISRHVLRPDIYPVEHAFLPSTCNTVPQRSTLVTRPDRLVSQRDRSGALRYGAAR